MADTLAYVRFSSDMQDENSFDFQLAAIRDAAQKTGDSILYTYKERAQSAKSSDRKEFLQMFRDIESGKSKVEKVYVYKFSRFMRNREESIFCKCKLKRLGVRVVSATEALPDDGPMGKMIEGIIEVVDQFYIDLLAETSLAGSIEIAKKGYWLGGPPPFGYRCIKIPDREGFQRNGEPVMRTDLEVYEPEARIVRRLFAIALATGNGGCAIYKQLCDEEGVLVPGRKGKPLGGRGVNAILRDPIYRGYYIYNAHGYVRDLGGEI